MWNLIKNVFRSLAKSKIAIIGLTFLIFLSVGMFTVLQSTTTNIDTTYDKISSQGNQHDFTVSEKYNTGLFQYTPGNYDQSKGIGKSSEDRIVCWPDVVDDGSGVYTKTYYYTLVADPNGDTLIDQYYAAHKDDLQDDLIYKTFTVTNDNKLEYTFSTSGDHKSTKDYTEIQKELSETIDKDKYKTDNEVITSEINAWSNKIVTFLSETNSPLNSYLSSDEDNMSSEVYFRNFSSLKINNAGDNVFWDVVQSSPDDEVDKQILFDNSEFNNLGWNNFSIEDWAPGEGIQNRDEVKELLSHTLVPWDNLKSNEKEQAIVRKLFSLLTKGDVGDTKPALDYAKNVESINAALVKSPVKFPDIQSDYTSFLKNFTYKDLNDKKYSYVISYEYNSGITPLPFTWILDDWTSHFCICAPQYMEKHNLMPLDVSKMMQADEDYQKWILTHQDLVNDRQRFIGWMNSLKQSELDNKINLWFNQFSQSCLTIGGKDSGGTPYFILSAGITGDYVYPVVSISKPIPDTTNECIMFVNQSGYESVYASYQGNETEKYVVGKFINPSHGNDVLKKINAKCRVMMSWPDNVKAAYMANDLSCTLNAAAFRINYIPQLVNKIDMLSYFLTIFILIVGLIISVIVVRRYIANSRTTIGVMRANGIKKKWIALSLTPFALVPSLIGGVCGYLAGTFLQAPAMSLFSAYWTLPTSLLAFSWLSLILSIFIPFIFFVLTSFISTYIVLRQKTTDLMKQGSEYKLNWLSKFAKKPFKHFGVLTRFRASIAFSSLWKLLILAVMSSLAMSTLVFGITLNGKFDTAINATNDTRGYKYAVDLYSPTSQGGQYIPVDANSFGQSGLQPSARNVDNNLLPNPYFPINDESILSGSKLDGTWINNIFKSTKDIDGDTSWDGITDTSGKPSADSVLTRSLFTKRYFNTTFSLIDGVPIIHWPQYIEESFQYKPDSTSEDPGKSYANLFVPFFGDAIGQKTDLMYLKNRQSTELTMNYVIGAFGLTSNPWSIAASLMPINQKSICERTYQNIINEVGEKVYASERDPWNEYVGIKENWTDYKNFINQIKNPDGSFSYQINQSNAVDTFGLSLSKDFIQFLIKIYQELPSAANDYELLYNSIPLSQNEETYTYLDAAKADVPGTKTISKAKIMGIDVESESDLNHTIKFVNLVDKNNKSLLNRIGSLNISSNSAEYPMLVNELVAKKYNLSIGSKLSFTITNKANRFENQINNSTSDDVVIFNIVGISKSRENEEFYIDQQIANYILGLKSKFNESKTYCLHNTYVDYKESNKCNYQVDDGSNVTYDLNSPNPTPLIRDINDELRIDTSTGKYDEQHNNIVPYGFNGYFTNSNNGGKALNSGVFYSPTGLYLPSGSIASNSSRDVLKYGENLYIVVKYLELKTQI